MPNTLGSMLPAFTFEPFESWEALLDAIAADLPIYYHAPLDYRPARVEAIVRRDGRLRVYPVLSREADPFTCGPDHLPRFRRHARAR